MTGMSVCHTLILKPNKQSYKITNYFTDERRVSASEDVNETGAYRYKKAIFDL